MFHLKLNMNLKRKLKRQKSQQHVNFPINPCCLRISSLLMHRHVSLGCICSYWQACTQRVVVLDTTAEGVLYGLRSNTHAHTHSVYTHAGLWGDEVKTKTYFRMTASPTPRCYSDMSLWHLMILHSSTSRANGSQYNTHTCPHTHTHSVWTRVIKLFIACANRQNISSTWNSKSQLHLLISFSWFLHPHFLPQQDGSSGSYHW